VARNTGLAAASHSLVAYTDDDAVVDPGWLTELIRPFEHPDVVCATGLVLPAELATPAQLLFEEFGAFDKGFCRAVWSNGARHRDLSDLGPAGDGGVLFPYSAGVFGSGNNMAFRVDWLRRHGGFDVALGAGTKSRGGEDLDAFLKVILADAVIVYEPRAVVRHYARGDMAALRSQMFGYGSGMSAVIAKHLLSSPRHALRILARLPAGLRKLLDPSSEKNLGKSRTFPKELSRQELRGYLAGPVLYVRSRVAARRHGLYAPTAPAALVTPRGGR
jgi:cellulose synthase/poly-beta-1,6-N-acetylglucosamine synthase-like glycosyltransferase